MFHNTDEYDKSFNGFIFGTWGFSGKERYDEMSEDMKKQLLRCLKEAKKLKEEEINLLDNQITDFSEACIGRLHGVIRDMGRFIDNVKINEKLKNCKDIDEFSDILLQRYKTEIMSYVARKNGHNGTEGEVHGAEAIWNSFAKVFSLQETNSYNEKGGMLVRDYFGSAAGETRKKALERFNDAVSKNNIDDTISDCLRSLSNENVQDIYNGLLEQPLSLNAYQHYYNDGKLVNDLKDYLNDNKAKENMHEYTLLKNWSDGNNKLSIKNMKDIVVKLLGEDSDKSLSSLDEYINASTEYTMKQNIKDKGLLKMYLYEQDVFGINEDKE